MVAQVLVMPVAQARPIKKAKSRQIASNWVHELEPASVCHEAPAFWSRAVNHAKFNIQPKRLRPREEVYVSPSLVR